jgi:hypothetical protein
MPDHASALPGQLKNKAVAAKEFPQAGVVQAERPAPIPSREESTMSRADNAISEIQIATWRRDW